jgi:hypothetical protein
MRHEPVKAGEGAIASGPGLRLLTLPLGSGNGGRYGSLSLLLSLYILLLLTLFFIALFGKVSK